MSDASHEPDQAPPADRAVLQRAFALQRPLARAARIAHANGSGYVVFGGLSLIFAAPGLDVLGLVIGALLLVVGANARRQAAALRRAATTAPQLLARGELILLAGLVLYGVLGLTVLPGAGDAVVKAVGNTKGLGFDVRKLGDSINTAWYAMVIGVAVLYQGGLARYFARRRADVDSLLREVPQWARELLPEGE